jgi:hypothetical protein
MIESPIWISASPILPPAQPCGRAPSPRTHSCRNRSLSPRRLRVGRALLAGIRRGLVSRRPSEPPIRSSIRRENPSEFRRVFGLCRRLDVGLDKSYDLDRSWGSTHLIETSRLHLRLFTAEHAAALELGRSHLGSLLGVRLPDGAQLQQPLLLGGSRRIGWRRRPGRRFASTSLRPVANDSVPKCEHAPRPSTHQSRRRRPGGPAAA